MSFSPFCRYKNFTINSLKALLDVYPDMASSISWKDAIEEIQMLYGKYKRTAYQHACQLGLEDRGREYFRIQNYLYTFGDSNLEKYLKFWFQTYYAPNPYMKPTDDTPRILFCEIGKDILHSQGHIVNYKNFFIEKYNGSNDDILLNAIKAYGDPIKVGENYLGVVLYVESNDIEKLQTQIDFIEKNFPIVDALNKITFFDRFQYSNFCKFYNITDELKDIKVDYDTHSVERQTGARNVLLYGVPGAGKSHAIKEQYCSDQRYIERVVFHPDYTYSDFIGQILPRVVREDGDKEGKLKYVFTPGPFTKMLKKAVEDPKNMYYLIIEEINRGNAAAIFGEVFQLLDRKEEDDYPQSEVGESEYMISNYDIAQIVYGDRNYPVRIASNMWILATMNTSDQNIFTIDTAFQRRWDIRHIENNVMTAKHSYNLIEGSNVSWGVFAKNINEIVLNINTNVVSLEDKRLGAYFVKPKELSKDRFPEKVLRYLWDDVFKLDKEVIFKEEYKSLDSVIDDYENTSDDKLEKVLCVDVYKKMRSDMQGLLKSKDV